MHIEDDAGAMGRVERQPDQRRGGIDIDLDVRGSIGQLHLLIFCVIPAKAGISDSEHLSGRPGLPLSRDNSLRQHQSLAAIATGRSGWNVW